MASVRIYIPDDTSRTIKDSSSSSSDDTDRCCNHSLGESSARSSLGSLLNNDHEDTVPSTVVAAAVLLLPSDDTEEEEEKDSVTRIWNAVQNNPSLLASVSEFHRDAVAIERDRNRLGRRRLETPSAAAAMGQIEADRRQFLDTVVYRSSRKESNGASSRGGGCSGGGEEERRLWSSVSDEQIDGFLCRLFLPVALGGLLD